MDLKFWVLFFLYIRFYLLEWSKFSHKLLLYYCWSNCLRKRYLLLISHQELRLQTTYTVRRGGGGVMKHCGPCLAISIGSILWAAYKYMCMYICCCCYTIVLISFRVHFWLTGPALKWESILAMSQNLSLSEKTA